jgi:hypothetical protein
VENTVLPDMPQATLLPMRIACWNTPSQYVILIAFPLQHRLHERASLLRYSTLPVWYFGVDSPSVCLVRHFSFTLHFQSNFIYSWLKMLFSDILYTAGQ